MTARDRAAERAADWAADRRGRAALRRGGVRRRVVLSTTVVTAVAMAATVGVVALIITNLSASRVDDELRGRIAAAATRLHLDSGGTPVLASSQVADADDSVWLYDTTGVLVSGPEVTRATSAVISSLATVTAQRATTHGDRRFLARPVSVRGHGVVGVMVASQSLHPYEQTRDVALYSLLALGLVVILGTASLTAWTVGRTLKPVHRMTAQAAEWSEKDLETRFDLGGGTDEFTELGNTLDALLDRVATALREEQRLTSELAHELRTPLTAIRGEAELGQLARPSDERYPRIIGLVDRLSSTITTLLAVARDQSGAHRRADVHAVVTDLLAARPRTTTSVTFDVPPGRFVVAVSAELAERALAPVLDNAFRYARTHVGISVTESESQIRIAVSDDGPGVAEADRPSMFDAGTRDTTSDGAGLGLALARRVASAAGGDVALVSSADPTVVELRLPRR